MSVASVPVFPISQSLVDPSKNKLLGEGSRSKVYLANDPESGEPLAVKVCQDHDAISRIFREYSSLKRLEDVPGIVKPRSFAVTSTGAELGMELINAPDLQTVVVTSPDKVTCEVFGHVIWQGLKTLSQLKSKECVWFDIKPDNTSFDFEKKVLKIYDGGSCFWPKLETHRDGMTPCYTSPEILLNLPISFSTDMWSFGVMIFCLYTRGAMFDVVTEDQFPEKKLSLNFAEQFGESYLELCGKYFAKVDSNLTTEKVERIFKSSYFVSTAAEMHSYTGPERDRWFKVPWRERILLIGKRRSEGEEAKWLIRFLEKVLVINPENRITPEQALETFFNMKINTQISVSSALSQPAPLPLKESQTSSNQSNSDCNADFVDSILTDPNCSRSEQLF
jgi:serine/threonine protein kinase